MRLVPILNIAFCTCVIVLLLPHPELIVDAGVATGRIAGSGVAGGGVAGGGVARKNDEQRSSDISVELSSAP